MALFVVQALKQASEKINKLESLLKLKEKLLITVREEKEREVTELMKIKNDLEVIIHDFLHKTPMKLNLLIECFLVLLPSK